MREPMGTEFGDVIQSIANANLETPQHLLKSWLDQLYSGSSKFGLSSSQLITLIRFLCMSPVLSLSTKLYIIENCLLPNDYISRDVSKEVARNLGTATAISEFKLQTTTKIQVALAKWLAQVYFLLLPRTDKKDSIRESDIWIHLWQFGYLQHWLTYILTWSSSSASDVQRWKVILLQRIGSKPSYQYGTAYATLILSRYRTLIGDSKLISDAISNLKCNARRLRTLQDFRIDETFLKKIQAILVDQSPSKFTAEIIEEILSSYLYRLQPSDKRHLNPVNHSMENSGNVQLRNTRTLIELAWKWNDIIEPKNVEPFFMDINALPQLLYVTQLTKKENNEAAAWKWISINLNMIFLSHLKNFQTAKNTIDGITRFCQISGDFIEPIMKSFLTLTNLKNNPSAFSYFWARIFLVVQSESFHLNRHEQQIMQIVAYCHLEKFKHKFMFPEIIEPLINCIGFQNSSTNEIELNSRIKILRFILDLVTSDFSTQSDDRKITMLITRTMNILPHIQKGISLMTPQIMNRFIVTDDPVLLDASCLYLIDAKKQLEDLEPENKLVQYQNQFIMDLTNYLWRNKLLSSRKFVEIPIDFLRTTINNLYLPTTEPKKRILFSITGIPALSYTSSVKLREIELKHNTLHNYQALITEGGFRKFTLRNNDKKGWLGSVKTIADLKVELLKELAFSGPYSNIPSFLFTYLKSLSQYSTGYD